MELEQITWEHKMLTKADIITFWFTSETVCPITLYELGYWLAKGKNILIGIDPKYTRKNDVEIQASLAGYDGKYYDTVEGLVNGYTINDDEC